MGEGIKALVTSGFRLHLGFYRFYDPPFKYGSLGLGISEPKFKLMIKHPGKGIIEGFDEIGAGAITKVLKELGLSNDVDVSLRGFMAHHVGLGSVTKVIMSLIAGLSKLGLVNDDLVKLAKRLGRGRFSCIGIYSSIYGGFIVDTGIYGEGTPRLLLRLKFPTEWYAVTVIPKGIKGLDDREERNFMEEPKLFSKQSDLYACLISLVTAINIRDFNLFSSSLRKIQYLTGQYFSSIQGGIYCCDVVEEVVKFFLSKGIEGIGQSSWGPTCYGFIEGYINAKVVRDELLKYLNDIGISAYVFISPPDNQGVNVRLLKDS